MFRFFKNRRRARLRAQPFPDAWDAELMRQAPYYARLPDAQRSALKRHLNVFLEEKHFEGCGGLLISDTIRLIIAAHACVLILGYESDAAYYPGLHSILVYPDAFRVNPREHEELGVVLEDVDGFEGESWDLGAVILSWRDVQRDMKVFNGRNIVFHEFAHQLYDQGGLQWDSRAAARRWSDMFMQHYEKHCAAVARGRPSFFDEYGAENPSEFFSIVTEAFFERPAAFQRRYSEFYEQMQRAYRQHPASYFRPEEFGGKA